MDDDRIWEFERALWTGDADVYRAKISEHCVMALPTMPYLFDAAAAIAAVSDTPRWQNAEFRDTRVERPHEGLIVIAYRVVAHSGEDSYHAACSSTLLRRGHEDWQVVQHQQTPFGAELAEPKPAD